VFVVHHKHDYRYFNYYGKYIYGDQHYRIAHFYRNNFNGLQHYHNYSNFGHVNYLFGDICVELQHNFQHDFYYVVNTLQF
jgi:hypothetical protein